MNTNKIKGMKYSLSLILKPLIKLMTSVKHIITGKSAFFACRIGGGANAYKFSVYFFDGFIIRFYF